MSLFNYECDEIKRIIDEVSPNYPQLTTYEKEWLFLHKYHYIPGIPVELEYETVNVNPYGSVENAIPYHYKSAILKGNTLINLVKQSSASQVHLNRTPITNGYQYTQQSSTSSITATRIQWGNGNGSELFKPSIKYYVQLEIKVNKNRELRVRTDGSGVVEYSKTLQENSTNFIKGVFTTPTDFTRIYIYVNPPQSEDLASYTGDIFEIKNLMIIEYQDGMENWDIPYFEGMTSVKMPVLTTSNEDGTKTNILTVNEDVTLRSNGSVYDELDLLTGKLTQRIDEDGSVLTQEVVKTVDLTPLNKPYEGVNHYHLTTNIPCEAILEVPVVSTGEQTLQEINNY